MLWLIKIHFINLETFWSDESNKLWHKFGQITLWSIFFVRNSGCSRWRLCFLFMLLTRSNMSKRRTKDGMEIMHKSHWQESDYIHNFFSFVLLWRHYVCVCVYYRRDCVLIYPIFAIRSSRNTVRTEFIYWSHASITTKKNYSFWVLSILSSVFLLRFFTIFCIM